MSVGSARMILLLVGPLAAGASSLESSRIHLVSIYATVFQVSLFLPRALSTAKRPPPPASLIIILVLSYRMLVSSLLSLREHCYRCALSNRALRVCDCNVQSYFHLSCCLKVSVFPEFLYVSCY